MMWIANPVITSDTIYTRQGFFDLRTGKMLTRTNPLTGEPEPWTFWGVQSLCAVNSGAENIVVHRALSLAMQDMKRDTGLHYWPEVRPGCWISSIAAGGLLLAPEASSSCQCSFNYKTSVALMPTHRQESWGVYFAAPPGKGEKKEPVRVRHMRLNLGAAGDKRDRAGGLWLSLPRPRDDFERPQRRATIFPVPVQREGLTDLYRLNADETPIKGTDAPWLYASCARGPIRLTMTVAPAGQSAKYLVRLHFAELEDVGPGGRVFDVRLQGKVAAAALDVAKQAGGRLAALVKEFPNVVVDADGVITLELVPRSGAGPILNGIEILEQKQGVAQSASRAGPPITGIRREPRSPRGAAEAWSRHGIG